MEQVLLAVLNLDIRTLKTEMWRSARQDQLKMKNRLQWRQPTRQTCERINAKQFLWLSEEEGKKEEKEDSDRRCRKKGEKRR